jgi:hypothetical protein
LPNNKADLPSQLLSSVVVLQEQAAVPLANQLTPRLLSQLLWCLGQLDVQLQAQLLLLLLLHSARQLQRQQCNSQDCAQLLQGLARLQQQPPVQWMTLFCGRVEQVGRDTVGKVPAFRVQAADVGLGMHTHACKAARNATLFQRSECCVTMNAHNW